MPAAATVAQLREFDEIIDVRSESEYAEDHVPGAISCPVLNDAERARVGTIYKQVSAFEAKRIGAALVSRNISRHLEGAFATRERHWRPLIYCWRGGNRSGALAHVLQQIGWRANQLDGGYRAYRREVTMELATLPRCLKLRVVCGLTGSGKSRLLRALARQGAQVLDLEALAAHRGSVLGNLPGEAQPGQKMFESRLWHELRGLDPARPVFIEAESRKIGKLRVPDALIAAMWASPCLRLEASPALRVLMLNQEYRHFVDDPALLGTQLELLAPHYGNSRISTWRELARSGRSDELVRELLETHYDPAYSRSMRKHYPDYADCAHIDITQDSDAAFDRLAARCLSDM